MPPRSRRGTQPSRVQLALQVETGWIDAELWGTDSSCGEPLELLASGRVGADAITCFTMNPTMAHQHLLWVWTFGGGSVREFRDLSNGHMGTLSGTATGSATHHYAVSQWS